MNTPLRPHPYKLLTILTSTLSLSRHTHEQIGSFLLNVCNCFCIHFGSKHAQSTKPEHSLPLFSFKKTETGTTKPFQKPAFDILKHFGTNFFLEHHPLRKEILYIHLQIFLPSFSNGARIDAIYLRFDSCSSKPKKTLFFSFWKPETVVSFFSGTETTKHARTLLLFEYNLDRTLLNKVFYEPKFEILFPYSSCKHLTVHHHLTSSFFFVCLFFFFTILKNIFF